MTTDNDNYSNQDKNKAVPCQYNAHRENPILAAQYHNPECIVLYSTKTTPEIYIDFNPLCQQYLESKVPVGILLDYLEENPEIIQTDLDKTEIIRKLRLRYTDPTELYDLKKHVNW